MMRASVTRRTVWGLMCHELIYENSSRAWLCDKSESQNTIVLLPHWRANSIPKAREMVRLTIQHQTNFESLS